MTPDEVKTFEQRLLQEGLYIKYREDLLLYGTACFTEANGKLVRHCPTDVKLDADGYYRLEKESSH